MRSEQIVRTIRRNPVLRRVSVLWHLSSTAGFLFRARIGHILTRLQQYGHKRPGEVWTRVAGRSLIATPVDRFRSVDVAIVALESLRAALQEANVTGEVLVSPPERSRVSVQGLDEALEALAEAPDTWYVLDRNAVRPLSQRSNISTTSPVRVFRVWSTDDGTFLAGADVGIDIVAGGCDTPSTPSLSFPVDAVITWVDGSDPDWRARKNSRRAGITTELHATSDNAARYESLDELKYCLRSIDMYAPWIRRIFLVTDNQVPTWLDPKNDRITIVDHREIFEDPDDLPTFNSHAIEARLHHIPGLAEHYVYFNDDVFLARALPPSVFFTPDGRPKVFLADDEIDDSPRKATDPPVVAAAKNNRELLLQTSAYHLGHKLKHVPHPQLRSLGIELEDRMPKRFRTTVSAPFRTPEDLSVASSLLPHYALASGRAVEGSIEHFYADAASPELRWRLPVLQETRDVDAICVNATTAMPQRHGPIFAMVDNSFPIRGVWEHIRR